MSMRTCMKEGHEHMAARQNRHRSISKIPLQHVTKLGSIIPPTQRQTLSTTIYTLNSPISSMSLYIGVKRSVFHSNLLPSYCNTLLSPSRFIMGMVFGKISVETPNYQVINSTPDYEIRKYPPSVVAEVTYEPSQFKGNKDGGFTVLANYIGALGNPQNTTPEKIAMTAPVITKNTEESSSEAIAMTAPVVTKASETGENNKKMVTMGFILPDKYGKTEEAPKPLDERVKIREEGERKYGVVKFAGVASDSVVEEKVEKLKRSLERDGFKVIGDFVLARYNPPWTLPPFRTNEVMIPVE